MVVTADRAFQWVAHRWAVSVFGGDHVKDSKVRAARHAEEAIELAQAFDVSKEDMQKVLDIVYSRPPGDPEQEAGGSLMTLAVLCESHDWNMNGLGRRELVRVTSKPKEHFQKRNAEKVHPK